MYRSLILISAIIYFSTLHQRANYTYVVVDRFCNCPEMEWKNNEFKLQDIHNSQNDIEIRLNIRTSRSLAQEVIISKHGKFEANLYYKTLTINRYEYPDSIKKYGKWEKFPFRKYNIKNGDLKILYSKLLSYNVGTIPDQSEVDKKPFLTTYYLECKIKNKVSTCYFGGNEELINEYPNVQAFQDYVGIIKTFNGLATDYYENAVIVAKKLDHL